MSIVVDSPVDMADNLVVASETNNQATRKEDNMDCSNYIIQTANGTAVEITSTLPNSIFQRAQEAVVQLDRIPAMISTTSLHGRLNEGGSQHNSAPSAPLGLTAAGLRW